MKPSLQDLAQLVGNPNAYAVQHEDGGWHPVREPLDKAVLSSHLRHEQTVGTYVGHIIDGRTMSRTLVFDLDDGNSVNASAIVTSIIDLGVPGNSIGLEFSGKKGFHVWLPLQDYRPNTELRRLGRYVMALARAKAPELSAATEVFPKQDEVRDLGNLIKLPGGIHQVSGKENNFISQAPVPLAVRRWEDILLALPAEQHARRPISDSRFPCMEEIQKGVDTNRNIKLFHLATMLRRAGVDDNNTEAVLRRVNELGDPLDESELLLVLDHSKTAGPVCDQIDRPCGDLCLRERIQGLYSRPGQLRFASEGEKVVVTLTAHEGKVVWLEHPDVSKMKAALK